MKMKISQSLRPSCFITIITLILGLSACTDSSSDSLTTNEGIEPAAQQTIETQSYFISIDNRSAQKLFSANTLDGDVVVSNLTEEQLSSFYPAVFDELALHLVTSDPVTSIYYDDPSINREIRSEF